MSVKIGFSLSEKAPKKSFKLVQTSPCPVTASMTIFTDQARRLVTRSDISSKRLTLFQLWNLSTIFSKDHTELSFFYLSGSGTNPLIAAMVESYTGPDFQGLVETLLLR